MQSTQLKITLPENLLNLVKLNAQQLGLTPSTYVRHLVIEDTRKAFFSVPEFPMSAKTEATALQAYRDFKAGKLKAVKNIEELFS